MISRVTATSHPVDPDVDPGGEPYLDPERTDPFFDPGAEPYVDPERTDPFFDPGAEPYTDPSPDEDEPSGAPDEGDPDA